MNLEVYNQNVSFAGDTVVNTIQGGGLSINGSFAVGSDTSVTFLLSDVSVNVIRGMDNDIYFIIYTFILSN